MWVYDPTSAITRSPIPHATLYERVPPLAPRGVVALRALPISCGRKGVCEAKGESQYPPTTTRLEPPDRPRHKKGNHNTRDLGGGVKMAVPHP